MPFLSGIELAAKIRAFCPDCKVLLFSGQANVAKHLMEDSGQQERFDVLQKPVHPVALLQRIHRLLDSGSSAAPPPLVDQTSAPMRPVQVVTISGRAYNRKPSLLLDKQLRTPSAWPMPAHSLGLPIAASRGHASGTRHGGRTLILGL
jgi:DNA-binding response OmpR family regulator